MECGAARAARSEVLLDAGGPQQVAVLGVNRIDIGLCIAEVNCVPNGAVPLYGTHGNCVAHPSLGLKGPIDATRGCAQAIDVPVIGADTDAARCHRRLAKRGPAGLISKSTL